MSEFKGTKGKFEVSEAIGTCGNVLYYNVRQDGHTIADFITNPFTNDETSLEKANYNAKLFSKAPELLEFVIHVYNSMPNGSSLQEKAVKLIKEATEL